MIAKFWAKFTNWLETFDLVPLMIIASAFHYVKVLHEDDPLLVAICIGLLVDLGHYRTVIIAARYNINRQNAKKRTFIARWFIALVMTAVSYAYHHQFYDGNILFAAPMPILIASLAYFKQHGFGEYKEDGAINEPAIAKSEPESTSTEMKIAPDEMEANNFATKQAHAEYLLKTGLQDPQAIMTEVGCSRATVTRALQEITKNNGR